jgi:hypothetical protein
MANHIQRGEGQHSKLSDKKLISSLYSILSPIILYLVCGYSGHTIRQQQEMDLVNEGEERATSRRQKFLSRLFLETKILF